MAWNEIRNFPLTWIKHKEEAVAIAGTYTYGSIISDTQVQSGLIG